MPRLTRSAHVEEEILAWRTSLESSRTLTTWDIDELESHVRDDLESLEQRGLTKREALWVALGRAGDPVALAEEYNKVNPGLPWARRFYWMALGFMLFTAVRPILMGVFGAPVYWLSETFGSPLVGFIGGAGLALGVAGGVLAVARAATSSGYGRLARITRRVFGWIDRHPVLTLSVAALPNLHLLAVVAGNADASLGFGGSVWILRNVSLFVAMATFFLIPPAIVFIARKAMRRT